MTIENLPFDRRAIPANACESRWTSPDGQSIRRIDWDLPADAAPRGSLLYLPGRCDYYEKYLETLDHWHRKGWQVTALDWRAQAGSGRMGRDDYTGHIDDFGTWVADLQHFWSQWKTTTPGPHVLIAHSMGGQLALRAVAERKVDPDATVLSAPMLGFIRHGVPESWLHFYARLMIKIGDPRRPAWKHGEKPRVLPLDRIKLLTHDGVRYADELWWREARPELAMATGSWGWVERAYVSMRGLFVPDLLETVQSPVLLLSTSKDGLVGFDAIKRAAKRLPKATLKIWGKELRHEVFREEDGIRDAVLAATDAFLDQNAPPLG